MALLENFLDPSVDRFGLDTFLFFVNVEAFGKSATFPAKS
jgi:hypothetical protein